MQNHPSKLSLHDVTIKNHNIFFFVLILCYDNVSVKSVEDTCVFITWYHTLFKNIFIYNKGDRIFCPEIILHVIAAA